MYWVIKLFLCLSTNSYASFSETLPGFDSQYGPESIELSRIPSKYEWLYKELIPEAQRVLQGKEAQRTFLAHLKDSQKYFPHPRAIKFKNLSSHLPYLAQGSITYVGFFPADYNYDLNFDEEGLKIEIRVHFKTDDSSLINKIAPQIKLAQSIWNILIPKVDFPIQFRFKVVPHPDQAHFSVKLIPEFTRGPYFWEWSALWSPNTIAHEFGHMMGLGDEYRTISGKIDCIQTSLMCSSGSGGPTFQHYYHILRRSLSGWKLR